MLLNQEIQEMIDQLSNIDVDYQDETTWSLILIGDDDATYNLEINLYDEYAEAYIYEDSNEISECCTDCEMELSGILDEFDEIGNKFN